MPKGQFANPEERARKISEHHKQGAFFNCLVCDKEFWRKPYAIKKGQNKFCSKTCYFKYQKGKNKKMGFRPHVVGKNNPNWKGGITPLNAKIRYSREYKKWRDSVYERDNWTCQECGSRSKKGKVVYLQAHHIKPFATFPELRLYIDNGITLCRKCHAKKPKGKEIYLCLKENLGDYLL